MGNDFRQQLELALDRWGAPALIAVTVAVVFAQLVLFLNAQVLLP